MRILMDSFHCFKHEIYDAIIKIKNKKRLFIKLNKLRQNAIKFDLVAHMNGL